MKQQEGDPEVMFMVGSIVGMLVLGGAIVAFAGILDRLEGKKRGRF